MPPNDLHISFVVCRSMNSIMYFVCSVILGLANAKKEWKSLSMMGVMKNPKQFGAEECLNPTNSTFDLILQLLDLDLFNSTETTNPCSSSPDTVSYITLLISIIALVLLTVVWIVSFAAYVRALVERRRKYRLEVNGVRYSRQPR
uniref:Uncharacterized protein n=1 Tax=Panagrellus redivivus TaxID=6233 RepID=A0A7E4UMN3_PANRE